MAVCPVMSQAIRRATVLDGPGLTVLSWPLQVDNQTEENNDMNKRRRKGFSSLDEVCVQRQCEQRPAAWQCWTCFLASLATPSFQAWLEGKTVGF